MVAFMIGLSSKFSNGQSFNGLRKLWQNSDIAFSDENRKGKLFTGEDFYRFAQTRDDKFAEYLKGTWYDYSIFPGLSESSIKHKVVQPVFDDSEFVMNPPLNLTYSKVLGFSYNLAGQGRIIPRIRKPETDIHTAIKGTFKFYGQPINICYDQLLTISRINSASEDSISKFWKSFSRSNSNFLVDQLMDYRDLLGLGDWGFFELVKATANCVFANNPLNADLLTWALMIRSGFDLRLAFNQSCTTILFPSENTIYSKQFVMIGQKRFYLDREMKSQLLVAFQNPFPENVRMIDLSFHKSLNLNGKLALRKLSYIWKNKSYEFALHFNPEVIRFYNDYPQTDAVIYFGAPVSSTLKEDLLGQFYPLLSKMGKTEAVAFLQKFVQNKFTYTSKYQKNGDCKCRFPEEVIASESGDDRSKSVLFSWLIRILVRVPIVGVQFPGFFSTAISFDKPPDGDSYYFNNEKYYITDPTFLNASIGLSMPEFNGLTPQLIDLSSSYSQPEKTLEIWKLAFKMGAQRGGTCQDIVFDRKGKSLITGYFTDRITYYPFIACFSPGNSLQWIRKFEVDGEAIAFAITKVSDDEIFVAGSFFGKIELDGVSLQSGSDNADLFFAQFNQNGELIWMNQAGIDSTSHDKSINYTVKIDRSGTNISTQCSNEDNRNINTGFSDVSDAGLSFTGSGSLTPGMFSPSWSGSSPDISIEFLKTYKFLLVNKCHPNVAAIVSLMKLIQKLGTSVYGRQLQILIAHSNPSFQVHNNAFFRAIGLVQQFKNENGIISMRTITGKPLVFENIKFEDGARFNYSFYSNGDLSLGMISGCHNLVRSVTLPLNSLLFDVSSGEMIVDYDHDHTIKTVSLGVILPSK